ncbi:hypothetical protein [Aquimarina brevivitae]|uniref:Uncharacterized protein n=1 Tax=Aquimarina brevivitae TaxID=323412 RepID=A0A4Q7PFW1_9FLAO|nr:hypothetical protein [Aquimarina brevivitae]RZS99235.1 hypothetical protein EV197_0444 [Aquimarina brevivitae]
MLKNVLKINSIKLLSKSDQKLLNGGFLPPFGDCCSCVFTPAGRSYPVFITQSCDLPCPEDGATEYRDTGC